MKKHPILMSTTMIQAILDGRKTQTRRVIKPQPTISACGLILHGAEWLEQYMTSENEIVHIGDYSKRHRCPYGQVGDHLWCKETWASDCTCENPECNGVIYKAGYAGKIIPDKWRPSIFLPRKFSRLTLEITEIRVQRVQEITDKEIQAEGVEVTFFEPGEFGIANPCATGVVDLPNGYTIYTTARGCFTALWNSINGKKYPWESNPYVWAITFKVIRQQ
ncbi:MAG: hypothetical protein WC455_20765 [Dehalococcoidia bacterium]|jgi:hypothetical protein